MSLPPLQFQLPLRSCIRFCTEAARKIQERWTGERNDEEREQSSSSLSLLFSPSPSLYPQLPPSRPQLNRIHPSLSLSLSPFCATDCLISGRGQKRTKKLPRGLSPSSLTALRIFFGPAFTFPNSQLMHYYILIVIKIIINNNMTNFGGSRSAATLSKGDYRRTR